VAKARAFPYQADAKDLARSGIDMTDEKYVYEKYIT